MTQRDDYRQILHTLSDWDPFLLAESGLPGPRANLTLAQAAADEGDESRFRQWLSYDANRAPTNTPEEFLAFCGVVGFGKLLADGSKTALETLRICASDTRWRMREGVCLALQRWGEADMDAFIDEMIDWAKGTLLEQRAAAAALCEPRLLTNSVQVERILAVLDAITTAIAATTNRNNDDFKVLRKGMAYCWSVAAAAYPQAGKPLLEKWCASLDKDIRWIMTENLKKDRLIRMDPDWVQTQQSRLKT